MANNSGIEIMLTCIAVCLLLVILIVMPIDIIQFYNDKEGYAMIYRTDANDMNWEWEYLSQWVYLGMLATGGLSITALRLSKFNNSTVQKLNLIFLILLFGSIVIGFYGWMKSGFDH